MLAESLAIIAVILVMAAMFARRGKRVFAAFSMPLVSVPVFHLIGWVWPPLGQWVVALDIAGLIVGITACAVFSRGFKQKRIRIGYFMFCCVFMVALTIAYLINVY